MIMGWRDAQGLRALGALVEDLGLFFMSGGSQLTVIPAPVDPMCHTYRNTQRNKNKPLT